MLVNALQFLARIQTVAVIAIGTIFFTYLIYPAVRWLRGRGVSLGGAIAIVYVFAIGIFALVAFFLSFVIPPLVNADQAAHVQRRPAFVQSDAGATSQNPNSPGLRYLPGGLRDYLVDLALADRRFGSAVRDDGGIGLLRNRLRPSRVIGTLVIIPILSIYLIFEAEGLSRAAGRADSGEGAPEDARACWPTWTRFWADSSAAR